MFPSSTHIVTSSSTQTLPTQQLIPSTNPLKRRYHEISNAAIQSFGSPIFNLNDCKDRKMDDGKLHGVLNLKKVLPLSSEVLNKGWEETRNLSEEQLRQYLQNQLLMAISSGKLNRWKPIVEWVKDLFSKDPKMRSAFGLILDIFKNGIPENRCVFKDICSLKEQGDLMDIGLAFIRNHPQLLHKWAFLNGDFNGDVISRMSLTQLETLVRYLIDPKNKNSQKMNFFALAAVCYEKNASWEISTERVATIPKALQEDPFIWADSGIEFRVCSEEVAWFIGLWSLCNLLKERFDVFVDQYPSMEKCLTLLAKTSARFKEASLKKNELSFILEALYLGPRKQKNPLRFLYHKILDALITDPTCSADEKNRLREEMYPFAEFMTEGFLVDQHPNRMESIIKAWFECLDAWNPDESSKAERGTHRFILIVAKAIKTEDQYRAAWAAVDKAQLNSKERQTEIINYLKRIESTYGHAFCPKGGLPKYIMEKVLAEREAKGAVDCKDASICTVWTTSPFIPSALLFDEKSRSEKEEKSPHIKRDQSLTKEFLTPDFDFSYRKLLDGNELSSMDEDQQKALVLRLKKEATFEAINFYSIARQCLSKSKFWSTKTNWLEKSYWFTLADRVVVIPQALGLNPIDWLNNASETRDKNIDCALYWPIGLWALRSLFNNKILEEHIKEGNGIKDADSIEKCLLILEKAVEYNNEMRSIITHKDEETLAPLKHLNQILFLFDALALIQKKEELKKKQKQRISTLAKIFAQCFLQRVKLKTLQAMPSEYVLAKEDIELIDAVIHGCCRYNQSATHPLHIAAIICKAINSQPFLLAAIRAVETADISNPERDSILKALVGRDLDFRPKIAEQLKVDEEKIEDILEVRDRVRIEIDRLMGTLFGNDPRGLVYAYDHLPTDDVDQKTTDPMRS